MSSSQDASSLPRDDPHCHAAAPYLSSSSLTHQFSTLAISKKKRDSSTLDPCSFPPFGDEWRSLLKRRKERARRLAELHRHFFDFKLDVSPPCFGRRDDAINGSVSKLNEEFRSLSLKGGLRGKHKGANRKPLTKKTLRTTSRPLFKLTIDYQTPFETMEDPEFVEGSSRYPSLRFGEQFLTGGAATALRPPEP